MAVSRSLSRRVEALEAARPPREPDPLVSDEFTRSLNLMYGRPDEPPCEPLRRSEYMAVIDRVYAEETADAT